MKEEVLRIIARECGLEETPALSTSLSSLDADSIDIISAIDALEERFGIEFPLQAEAIGIESVGDVVATVKRQMAARGAGTPRR